MKKKDIEEQIKIIYSNFFGVSIFKLDLNKNIIEQFNADSVDMKELLWIINEEFDVSLNENDILSISSIVNILCKN